MAFSFTTRPTARSTDETGWRQNRKRAWLWTVVTAGLTVFRIDRGRGGTVVEELLGTQFAGVVGSDRWSAYQRFPAGRRALCYAHLKRDFQAPVDRGEEAASLRRWGLAVTERLFAMWHRFRAGELDRQQLQRKPMQAWLGRVLRDAGRRVRPAKRRRSAGSWTSRAAGSRFAERLLTVAASCRQRGRPLLDCLVAAGEAALRGSAPPSVIPAPRGD